MKINLSLVLLFFGLASSQAYWRPLADPVCNADGTTCTPDCLGLRICTGGEFTDISCKTQTNGTLLYCNSVTLKCDINEDNCIENGGTTCPLGDGTFPVLNDCHRYYTCDDNYRVNYMCDPKAVYDPATEKCSVSVKCPDFSSTGLCKGAIPRLIAHPLKKHFYVVCSDKQPELKQCKFSDDYLFNPDNGGCQFNCSKEGKFQDFDDKQNTWYFECVKSGTGFIQSHLRCSQGTTFDPESQICQRQKPETTTSDPGTTTEGPTTLQPTSSVKSY